MQALITDVNRLETENHFRLNYLVPFFCIFFLSKKKGISPGIFVLTEMY